MWISVAISTDLNAYSYFTVPAQFYAFLGEKNRAFDWLERGYLERNTAYSALNVEPLLG